MSVITSEPHQPTVVRRPASTVDDAAWATYSSGLSGGAKRSFKGVARTTERR
jgi:hypothetical protein